MTSMKKKLLSKVSLLGLGAILLLASCGSGNKPEGSEEQMTDSTNIFSKLAKGIQFGIYHPAEFMMASKSLIYNRWVSVVLIEKFLLKNNFSLLLSEWMSCHKKSEEGFIAQRIYNYFFEDKK